MKKYIVKFANKLRARAAIHGVQVTDENLNRFIADEMVSNGAGDLTSNEMHQLRRALNLSNS